MLLRRVTQHVKDQNWFAVLIDFAIVVFGVFIGIQVANWNAARELAAREISFLRELQGEIRLNNEVMSGRITMMHRVIEAGERSQDFLQGDQSCGADCWQKTVDMFHASQVMHGPSSRTVYDQMQRLDLPKSGKVKEAMARYYRLDSAMSASFDRRPKFRNYVRKYIPAKVQRELWDHCYDLVGITEVLIADCAKASDDDLTRPALDALRANPDIAHELNYWLGMHDLWIPIFTELVEMGEEAVETIDRELESR